MKNKHFIPGFLLGLLVMLVIAAVPIANLVLQTDMNAGGHSITNVVSVTDTNGNPITGGSWSGTNNSLSPLGGVFTVNGGVTSTGSVKADTQLYVGQAWNIVTNSSGALWLGNGLYNYIFSSTGDLTVPGVFKGNGGGLTNLNLGFQGSWTNYWDANNTEIFTNVSTTNVFYVFTNGITVRQYSDGSIVTNDNHGNIFTSGTYYGNAGGLTNGGGATLPANTAAVINSLQAATAAATVVSSNALYSVYVDNFGAVGNATNAFQVLTNAAGSYTVTSSSALPWAVGENIEIWNANGLGTNLATIITNVVSSTQCLVSNASTVGVTNGTADFGTDDTAAFQAAINNALAVTNSAVVRLKYNKHYFIDGPYATNNFTTNKSWCQLQLPYIPYTGAHKTIEFAGDSPPSISIYPAVNEPMNIGNSVIIDSRSPTNSFASFCMIGQPYAGTGTWGMNAITFCMKNIEIRCSYPTTQTPLNLRYVIQAILDSVLVDNGQPTIYDLAMPPSDNRGIVMPTQSNDTMSYLKNVCVRGFGTGIEVGDNSFYPNMCVTLNRVGLKFAGISAVSSHGTTFGEACVFGNVTNISQSASGTSGIAEFTLLDIEHDGVAVGLPAWTTTIWDVDDPANLFIGSGNYIILNDASSTELKFNGSQQYCDFRNLLNRAIYVTTNNLYLGGGKPVYLINTGGTVFERFLGSGTSLFSEPQIFTSGNGLSIGENNVADWVHMGGTGITNLVPLYGNLGVYYPSNTVTLATIAAGMTNGGNWLGTLSNKLMVVNMNNGTVTAYSITNVTGGGFIP